MNAQPQLPPAVENYLRTFFLERTQPLLLSFDPHWNLRDVQGDAALFGIDAEAADGGVRELQDLFIGLSLDNDQDLPFVELSSGRSAHVHLIADTDGFHLLLLDAEDSRSRLRAQQQLGNEAVLAGQAKSKAISRLREIRSELERQRATLEEANALKNALIATLSHEFRTPLTSIFGYLHLLDRRGSDGAHAVQALSAIRRNATYLFTLAENLLEYGRGESGALLCGAAVDLRALARDIDEMIRPLAEDKGLHFSVQVAVDDPAPALFDEVRLRQIVINLLSNAVRYTAKGGIGATLAWRDGHLHVEVRDTGIGISPEFQASVFKPFNRGGQSGSKGAGLGLSIVRRLVEQMHGTMTLESQPACGTRFLIDLPPLERIAVIAEGRGHSALWVKDRYVLVVDDDPDIAHLLEALLLDLGFRVLIATDAAGALAEPRRQAPDVLLIDVEMPGLSGNAAVYQLRSHGYRGRIVTLSATSTVEARDASLRAGADHYLTKPLNVEQFVSVMQRVTQSD
ncbi:MAG: hybrid sensor histidine kinase/response regulator [Dokdonella sp.]